MVIVSVSTLDSVSIVVVVGVLIGLSAGFLEGSKLIIRILGIQPSGVSNPPALAVRFLLWGGDEDDGDDEDMLEIDGYGR